MNKHSVVIVGGGISGLSAAFFLSRRASQEHLPLKITVLEASDRFGGVICTLTHENLRMEAGADAFYAGQEDATELCHELGLQEDLIEASPCFRHFFSFKNKKFYPVPGLPGSWGDVLRLLSNSRLRFSTKCRMLWEPFVPRRKEEGDESFASFIRRRLGPGFYRELAKPLVRDVYMMDPERLSMDAVFPRLRQAEKTYGSLAGSFLDMKNKKTGKLSSEFFTLTQGLEGLTQALVRELKACELRRSMSVRQCAFHKGWEVFLENGEAIHADSLCLAMSACDAAKLLSGTAPDLSAGLSDIRYDSIAVVNLIYRSEDVPARDLDPGFLVSMEGKPDPFSSLKWIGRSADGKSLSVRAFLSKTMTPESFSENDETLKRKILTSLSDFLAIKAPPLFSEVKRYPSALPQYETGHLERVARIESMARRYPGLYLTGNGLRGFGITDCIRQAKTVASCLEFPVF